MELPISFTENDMNFEITIMNCILNKLVILLVGEVGKRANFEKSLLY